jgi:hypothetical protein
MRVAGSYAVVTGASSGIGRAVAERLAARGCRLLLVGRDRDRLAAVAERTGGEVAVVDLADAGATAEFARRLAAGPPPDLLVNNAGMGAVGDIVDPRAFGGDAAAGAQPLDHDLDRLVAVHLRAPIALTHAVVPAMVTRGRGHLVFVTSIAGLVGVARESLYAAVKAGLHMFAASVRAEVAPAGVGVTTVAPGAVRTAFFDRRGAPYTRRLPRPVAPERVADALVTAVERDRAEVIVPRWLRLPVVIRAATPTVFGRLSARWGGSSTR